MSPGQSIAYYRVTSKLGEGGMGAVYRTTNTKAESRRRPSKVLPDAFAAAPTDWRGLSREAQLLASLNHPNIASIYGVEECGKEPAHSEIGCGSQTSRSAHFTID